MRYYEDYQDTVGVTPSRLKRFGADRQWPYIRHWFHRMFEDPSNETPIVDGEFLYIWGGPYDALDEIQQEFPDIPFDRLESFARRLESNGVIDWAPGRDHPDHVKAAEEFEEGFSDTPSSADEELENLLSRISGYAPPSFNRPTEREERNKLSIQLQTLEHKLDDLITTIRDTPSVGHNKPPPEYALEEAVNVAQLVEARHVAADAQKALGTHSPDPTYVGGRLSYLRKLLSGLAVSIPSGFAGGMATVVGKNYLAQNPEIASAIEAIITQAVRWIQSLFPLPF